MKINNKRCVSRVSIKNLFTSKTRCIVSVIAIALTTILFTSLFTILMTIAKGFEESNFRQVGTYSHAEFKRLTKEQYDELRVDEDILEYGLRRVAGITTGEAFAKSYAEVSYMDKNTAKWGYCTPETGTLPKENTNEATVDTRVLSCLGIEPEIGKSFTLTMDIDGIIVTEDFVLSGWWEYDEASPASHVLIPESRLEELFTKYNVQFNDDFTGKYGLNVMLKSDHNIEEQMVEILERHGFVDGENSESAIAVGVNWGYMGEKLAEGLDLGSVAIIAVILLFIVFTGYLIIYNIFRISVANDIRHYGMLKTIGTTQTQIKSMVQTQALILSVIGIPIGLIVGWITGCVLCPVVMSELNVYNSSASVSPWIFVFSALFAWITVMISCFRPAKTAGKVSPVEALRYTEQASGFSNRSGKKGVSLFGMAAARLTGSKGKTVLVVASLALSIVTFTLTFILANSFSMEKYLSDVQADFLVADSQYFAYRWDEENAISLEENEFLRYMDGVTDSFVTYGVPSLYYPETYFSEEAIREIFGDEDEFIDEYISYHLESDGTIEQRVQLLGLEDTAFSKLKIYEGDIAKLSESGYIAVEKNDYFKLGDKLTFIYCDKWEYTNTQTGTTYTDSESIPINEYEFLELNEETHKVEYEIAAVVDVPYTLGYRFSMDTPLFITSSEDLLVQSEYCKPLYIAFDTTDEAEAEMEKFLADYTETNTLSYTSRATEEASFESFKRMFVILGAALSIIVGLIGVLNFINTMITSINSRQREIAALQAMGMTGRQLCTMLVWEGVIYIGGATITALILNLITIPLGNLIEEIFWFCDYSFTLLPLALAIPVFAVIGTAIPAVTYRILTKKSIVERLRGNE